MKYDIKFAINAVLGFVSIILIIKALIEGLPSDIIDSTFLVVCVIGMIYGFNNSIYRDE